MASIKIAYVGGGSSRAAGTMASLLAHGKEFDGSHVVLIDQRQDRLDLVERIAQKLVAVLRASTSRWRPPRISGPG